MPFIFPDQVNFHQNAYRNFGDGSSDCGGVVNYTAIAQIGQCPFLREPAENIYLYATELKHFHVI